MGENCIKSYVKGDYEGFYALKAARKQSQFKAKQSQSPGFGRKLEAMDGQIVNNQ